ncbi:hypothetical protein HZB04_01945 [Candidatus Wolfebacteria bacterium]|nr:hypothetical protein [Candidatus Wolfebacteria bacterium]
MNNKKKYFILISAVFLAIFSFFNFVNAKFEWNNITIKGIQSTLDINNSALNVEDIESVVSIIISVLNWTYSIFFVIAVLMVVFAAYEYLTGAEDPERIKNAHKRLIWAAVAIVVALLALSFNLIVKNFIDKSGSNNKSGVIVSPAQP